MNSNVPSEITSKTANPISSNRNQTGYYRSSAFFAQTLDEAAAHVKTQIASEASSQRRDSVHDLSSPTTARPIVGFVAR